MNLDSVHSSDLYRNDFVLNLPSIDHLGETWGVLRCFFDITLTLPNELFWSEVLLALESEIVGQFRRLKLVRTLF